MLATVFSMVSCATGKSGRTGDQAATKHDMHQPPAAAQHEHDHAGHKMGPAVIDGSWSYLGRTNPKPFTDKRWEMVPVPGYGHMYVNSGNLSRELICESLQDNPSIMVDRVTRKDCGMPDIPPVAAAGRAMATEEPVKKDAAEHEHHAGMEMPREDHAGRHEHWTAPEEAAKRPNPIPSDPASIERGRALFQTHCAVCHGPKGQGDGPAAAALTPRPDNLAVMAGQHPAGDLAWKIANGRGAMPAWKGILTEPQIWDLVNFLKDLKKPKSKSEPPSHRHDEPGHAH
jgi:mono/diheme cytochrome c family protein